MMPLGARELQFEDVLTMFGSITSPTPAQEQFYSEVTGNATPQRLRVHICTGCRTVFDRRRDECPECKRPDQVQLFRFPAAF